MSFKRIDTNEVEIRINAKRAGDFGFVRIGGMERTPREEYRRCEEIVSNINRHVDDVGWIGIEQKKLYETEDGEQFETLYEVLHHLYNDGYRTSYEIRYVRPSDKGVGTRRSLNSFEEVIIEAYWNPHGYEVLRGEITDDQRMFLTRVIDASLDEKMLKEASK